MTQDSDDLCSSVDPSQVVDMGDGPSTILFLHGLFGTPDHWRGVMEKLADRYRVIAPQLPIDPQPGRRSNGMKTIGDLSAAVTDLVQELGIAPLVICGNSLGGLVAIDICIQQPDLAKGLVLAGSAGLFERSPITGLRSRPDKDFVRSTINGILHDHSLVTEDLVDHWHHSVMDRDYARFLLRVSRATRDRCVENDLGKLKLPTMIVWGRNDEITPPSTGEEFQRRINGSRIEFIDDCGHAPNWEQPAAFARLMDEFLPSCLS
jgi:pimeloyl-ACP methyl ester carboxylesterase